MIGDRYEVLTTNGQSQGLLWGLLTSKTGSKTHLGVSSDLVEEIANSSKLTGLQGPSKARVAFTMALIVGLEMDSFSHFLEAIRDCISLLQLIGDPRSTLRNDR